MLSIIYVVFLFFYLCNICLSLLRFIRPNVKFGKVLYEKMSDISSKDSIISSILTIVPSLERYNRSNTSSSQSNYHISGYVSKPFKEDITWYEVFQQMKGKLTLENMKRCHPKDNYKNIDKNISMEVITQSEYDEMILHGQVEVTSPIVLLVGLESIQGDVLLNNKNIQTIVTFNCSKEVDEYSKFGDIDSQHFGLEDNFNSMSFGNQLSSFIRKFMDLEAYKEQEKLMETNKIISNLWTRKSTDDLLFMLLILIDTFKIAKVKSIQAVTSTSNTGMEELKCMCQNCFKEMIDCFLDENCRKALNCLTECKGNDQVCSYRCITSYESIKFQNFAYCILQKNNCMKYSAPYPYYPDPLPMTTFRNQPLTHILAEDIFIGHLQNVDSSIIRNDNGLQKWSWKVICGQNPAYDYFACQHQLFYRDVNKSSIMWYDPVFKVVKLNGEDIWRRRHYRVKRAKIPGQFFFHVIDNGVASNEFWRILDCDDNMNWAVFYYSGIAERAGTSYTGALVVSKDGNWPIMQLNDITYNRIKAALAKGGIETWELFEVSNCNCDGSLGLAGPPPLDIPYLIS